MNKICSNCKIELTMKKHPVGSGLVFYDCLKCKGTFTAKLSEVMPNVVDLGYYKYVKVNKSFRRKV